MYGGLRKWKFGVLITVFVLIILNFYDKLDFSSDNASPRQFLESFKLVSYDRVSWENSALIYRDSLRVGFGEHGEPAILTDPEDIKENDNYKKDVGSSVLISDKISVNRSIPDQRVKGCLSKQYLENLPQVSIVMIFHNDIFSLFKRTLHSLYNRTPHELIKEVILVNDASTLDYLYKPLEDYIKENFPELEIRIINLEKRSGLVTAWMTGFRNATAEYIFCMEAHMELGYNWLPPLLEIVVLDNTVVAVPTVDNIHGYNDMHIDHMRAKRFIFDWSLNYGYMSLLPGSDPESTIAHQIPTMTGGKFLFKKDFFFKIGGYDEKYLIWGAENWDLSLKVNLCGGKLMEVPCSHVAHHFGFFNKWRKLEGVDFEGFNNKRFVEVWLDEFKEYVYKRNPGRYDPIDPGDLTEQKAIRAACKPFRYFLEVVAPDMLAKSRFEDFVRGTIKLVGTNLCVDTMSAKIGNPLGLYECDLNSQDPKEQQNFELTYFRDIRLINSQICWDNLVSTQNCTRIFGNQTFAYDEVNKRIIQDGTCLEANLDDKSLWMTECHDDLNYKFQKWEWGFMNVTAMQNFDKLARKIVVM